MTNYATLPTDGQPLAALRGFLRGLLEQGIVDALLVPQPVLPGDSLVQTLVRDAAMLERADPIYPLMPVQSARLVSNVSATNPGGKVGVVLWMTASSWITSAFLTNSQSRSIPFPRVLAFPTGCNSPSRTAKRGLTLRMPPRRALPLPMRPPRRRYFNVSKTPSRWVEAIA